MHFHIAVTQLTRVVLALSFATIVFGMNSSPFVQAQEQKQVNLSQFDVLTPSSGWILLDQHLFWTSDAGQTWNEISPSISSDAAIQDVEFIDTNTGWVLWTTTDSAGGAYFQLTHTIDSGITWVTRSLSLFELGEIGSYAEKAEMGWFDAQTGWISVKQISGSNFSIGVLFRTSDGGNSWSRFILPVADKIYFSDPQMGWAIGGPTDDQVFNTQDAGATWKNVRPADIANGTQATTYPPFVSGGQGLLVMTTVGVENNLKVYSLENSGKWLPLGQVKLDVQPGIIGISFLDAQNFVTTIPGTKSIVRMTNGELDVLNNEDGLSASIVEVDMVSLDVGWAKSIDSSCVNASLPGHETVSVSCSSSTRLLQTANGGITWQSINLPIVHSDAISSNATGISPALTMSTISALENTEVFIGQGFDKCEIPSISQMQAWWDGSPYKTVNLYIGGSSRACENSILSPSYLSQLYQQGWKFIPTWVGPQAPCTGYISRISSDVDTAYGQGVNQANLAVERLAALGLTDPKKTGSVVYYDIEYYGTDPTCRSAVNAFVNGWVSQIHARGNMAGVYGSTQCNTGLSDFLNITNMPDVIWPARWYHNPGSGYYDPNASVWDLGSCIPNTAWSNHERIRQYEGEHNESWGGLILAIDSNVLDGVVAVPYITPVEINIAGDTQGTYQLVSHESKRQSYANVNNGPVQIVSANSSSLIAAERVIYNVNGVPTSFSEMMGLPNSQLNTTYWLPWYNNVDLSTQLRFGNVSGSTATVHVYIGEQEMVGSPFTLTSGQSTRVSFAGIDDGPVKVESNVNIVAAERVIYAVNGVPTSFSEMMGLPNSQLNTTYWLPWYNNVDLDTQLRFGNVSGSTATVHVLIGGSEMNGSPFTLTNGQSTDVSFAGINNGPVKIVSNVNIVAAERVIYHVNGTSTSLSEMMGLPDSQLNTTYWMPWYNNVDLSTQLRFGNVSGSTATVHVFIGGSEIADSPYTIIPGKSIRVSLDGVNNGPVQIVSNVNIMASERVIYTVNGVPTSFSEMMGLPNSQLNAIYWMPWYNNVDLDTQLRFGVP